jgi:hypothetical protein
MNSKIKNTISLFLLSVIFLLPLHGNDQPPVKKSSSGICHPKGGSYYDRTRNFTSFNSMEECIKSGGRPPKR